MKKTRLTKLVVVAAVAFGLTLASARTASASGFLSLSVRSSDVCHSRTYFRTVRVPVTVVEYRLERREVTTYVTRRRWEEESYFDEETGEVQTRLVLRVVREPVTTIEYVRVPVYRTVYRTVSRPVTTSIVVGRTSRPTYTRRHVRPVRRPVTRAPRHHVPSRGRYAPSHIRGGYTGSSWSFSFGARW